MFQPLNESRYLLVEFDLSRDIHDISYADEYLQEIVYHNMIPVIAHVERYFLKGLDLKLIDYWLDCGYVLQCNRSSLVGIHGKLIQKNAMALLKRESIHLVCSDCHRANGSRVSKLSDAYDWICCNVSREYADLVCTKNPLLILNDLDV